MKKLFSILVVSLLGLYLPLAEGAPPCTVTLNVSNDADSATFVATGPGGRDLGIAVAVGPNTQFFQFGQFDSSGRYQVTLPVGSELDGLTINFGLYTGCGISTDSHTFVMGGSGDSAPMLTANRVRGMAPLAVFFDAVPDSSGVVQPLADSSGHKPYESLKYDWDFDDDETATWLTSGKSKNKATGYVAGHVFERPGTYDVKLTVTKPDGTKHDYEQRITVDPFITPANRTFYVSEEGSDSNDGLSEARPFRTWAKAVSVFQALPPTVNGTPAPARLRFKRGDTFRCETDLGIRAPAESYQVDSYGSPSDPNPLIDCYGSKAMEIETVHPDSPTRRAKDIRVLNLDFDGNNGTTNDAKIAIDGLGEMSLFSGLKISRFERGAHTTGTDDLTADGNFIVDCSFEDLYRYGIYLSKGIRTAFLGNRADTVRKEHLIRSWLRSSRIAHNILENAAPSTGTRGGTYLKLVAFRAPGVSEYVVVADNQFLDSNVEVKHVMEVGPQGDNVPGFSRDIIVERNLFDIDSPDSTSSAISSRAGDYITVRNNVIKNVKKAIALGDPVDNHTTWKGWKILNNSFYFDLDEGGQFLRNDPNEEDIGVRYAEDITVKNNIISMPNSDGPRAIYLGGTDPDEVEASNNTWHFPSSTSANGDPFQFEDQDFTFSQWIASGQGSGSLELDPNFVSPASCDLRLQDGSPAIDAGLDLDEVFYDITGAPRPQGLSTDMGAYER